MANPLFFAQMHRLLAKAANKKTIFNLKLKHNFFLYKSSPPPSKNTLFWWMQMCKIKENNSNETPQAFFIQDVWNECHFFRIK